MAQGNMVGVGIGPTFRHTMPHIVSYTPAALAPFNTGFAIRHQAEDASPVTGVRINWSSIAGAGAVTVSYQSIDPTTGKPSGLYDAAAIWTGTPTLGWQTITFATPPSTPRVRGTEYAIVIITTTGGTTHSLNALSNATYSAGLPSYALTTTDGGVTWSEAGLSGVAVVVTSAGDEIGQIMPWSSTTGYACYGNRAAGVKCVLPAGLAARYVSVIYPTKQGTLDGNFTLRALDVSKEPCAIGASGYVVATATIDKDSLTNSALRTIYAEFDNSDWSVGGGTFRLVLQQMAGNNAANYITVYYNVGPTTIGLTNWLSCTTTDISASPVVWTETDYHMAQMELGLQSYAAPGYPPRIRAIAMEGGVSG